MSTPSRVVIKVSALLVKGIGALREGDNSGLLAAEAAVAAAAACCATGGSEGIEVSKEADRDECNESIEDKDALSKVREHRSSSLTATPAAATSTAPAGAVGDARWSDILLAAAAAASSARAAFRPSISAFTVAASSMYSFSARICPQTSAGSHWVPFPL